MKKHEKESFAKSFLIFFLSLEMLIGVIAVFYYQDKKSAIEETIFLEMKTYNYTLEGDMFGTDIIPKEKEMIPLVLVRDKESLFSYFPIPFIDDFLLKISYPKSKVDTLLEDEIYDIAIIYLVVSVVVAIFSLLYSFYALGPLRRALLLLEEFLKDIIHDLNTPVTSILINTKLLRQSPDEARIKRIELGAKTIGSLHKNLQSYLNDLPGTFEEIELDALLDERINYYSSLYANLRFERSLSAYRIMSDRDALQRVLDNILSNACKYNRSGGSVKVTLKDKVLLITDTGIGIKNPQKAFERFYKEGERGIGIGLHIVKKLCDELGIAIQVDSDKNGTEFRLYFR